MKKIIAGVLLLALSMVTYGCGGGAGSSTSPKGEDPGVPSIVQLLPSHSIAQTNSAVTLHAKVLDGNGAAVRNVPVRFTKISAIGDLYTERDALLSNPVVKTNGMGIATIRLKSFVEGFATVQAEVNKGVGFVRDRKTVFFAVNTNLQPFMALDVDGDNDGVFNEPEDFKLFNPTNNQAIIRATVFNKFGQRAFGSFVTFGSDSPEVSFPTGNTAFTNQNGEAFVLIQVDPSVLRNFVTVVNITAIADNGAANMVSLFLQPVTVSRVAVTASPSVVAPNGNSSIVATVFLNTGTSAPDGSTVSFVASCGSVTPFAQTVKSVATATFTAPSIPPSSGTCTVTASIGGVTSSPPATIFVTTALTVQPAAQTINGGVGGNAIYTIFGGVPPYTVTSSKPGVAFNGTAGNGIWTITSFGGTFTVRVAAGTPPDAVTLTVRDAVGTTKDAALTIGAGTSLSVQPGEQTVAVGNTATFNIFGGSPPYNVFSNDASLQPDPPTVTSSGGSFEVHIPAITSATSVTFTVVDGTGTTATAKVNITSSAAGTLLIVPGTVTAIGPTGGTFTFSVVGGTPGYVITSTDPLNAYDSAPGDGTWNVAASGGTFDVTVPPGAPAKTVTLNVFDSAGGTKTATIVIQSAGLGTLTIVPGSATAACTTGGAFTFTVSGGTPSYVITSTDPLNAYNTTAGNGIWNVGSSGGTFTVTVPVNATPETVTLNVFDSIGGTKSGTLTIAGSCSAISAALAATPSSISLTGLTGTGDQVTFTITGGTAPYSMFSTNTAVIPNATVVGNQFAINPFPVSSSTAVPLTVVDHVGAIATATVTVTPASSSLAVNPSTIAVFTGTTGIGFTIIGGLPDFAVYSSNPAVLQIASGCGNPGGPCTFSGSTFSANAIAPGTSTVTIVDSDGKTVTAAVTVTASTLAVTPSTATVNCTTGGTATFTATGGVPNYAATSSNGSVVIGGSPITFSGGTFTATLGAGTCGSFPAASTPVSITVQDSLGTKNIVVLTVTNP